MSLNTFFKKITFLIIISLVVLPCSAQQSTIDTLLTNLAKIEEDTLKVNHLLDIAIAYRKIDIDKTIDYNKQALSLSKAIKYNEGIYNALNETVRAFYFKSAYKQAFLYLEEALAFSKANHATTWELNFLNSKAILLARSGKYTESLSILYDCLEQVNNDSQRIAKLWNSISLVQEINGDYDKAVINADKALKIYKNLKDEEKICATYVNISVRYWNNNQLDSAALYSEKSLLLSQKIGDERKIAKALSNLGGIYTEIGKYEIAEKYVLEALSIDRKLEDKFGVAYDFFSLGDLNQALEKYKQSNNYYLKGLSLFKEMEMTLHEKMVYEELAANYAALGMYDKAYEAQKNYEVLNDSLFTQDKDKQLQELTTKYESEQKAQENELLKAQQFKNELEIKQRTIFGWASIGLVGILGCLIFWINKQRKLKAQALEREIMLLKENIEHKEIIEQQSKKLHLVDTQKNKLFTNIAHELQTPLNVIQGLGKELYKSSNLSNSERDSLAIMIRNGQRLSDATSHILTVNKTDGHSPSVKGVNFYLAALLDYLLPEYRFLAQQKDIIIEVKGIDDALLIYLELNKLEVVLKNLLINAIKYSDEKGMITIAYQESATDFHQIQIRDTGRGISESDLPLLFDKYYQSEGNNPEGGFGIGLTMCKDYIASMDGKIEIESKVGIGTSVMISIPKQPITTEPIYEFPKYIKNEVELLPTLPSEIEQAEILIVEDNYDFCKYLETILGQSYQLVFVHNGQKAMEYLEENVPELIITDWMMPQMDGFTLVQHLKKSPFAHIPILMLTARNLEVDKLKALRVGIDDYLIKPVETATLKNSIINLLNFKADKDQQSNLLPPQENWSALSIVDQNWLLKLEESIAEVIQEFSLNIEEIADSMEISSKQLNTKIKEMTGMTAKKYIQEIRYWEARRMLETGVHDSVKAVSYSVGFKDTKNFSRRFKERFGKYPSEYLKAENRI